MTIKGLNVAVIGGGVIGAGWVARFNENGINVAVYDPAPDAEDAMSQLLCDGCALRRG